MYTIVVNGATGWLGSATLRAVTRIEAHQDPWLKTFLGSFSRTHSFHDLGNHEILNSDVNQLGLSHPDIFVNLAFKTRDYILKLGKAEYTKINIGIIENSTELARRLKPKSIILVSSGVVTKYQESAGQVHNDAYTKLKIHEEEEFKKVSKEINANLVILRMWAASGADMTEPEKYGIGNLLIQSRLSPSVVIESPTKVFRRYADASQQLEICLRLAMSGDSLTLNSGGVLLEIRDLAKLIISEYSPRKKLIQRIDDKEKSDDYFWSGHMFEEYANKVNVELYSIAKQLELTKFSVDRYLNEIKIGP